MTNYIQGPALGKVDYIRAAGAEIVSQPTLEQVIDSWTSPDAYVLVVNNGPFEAAAPIEDERDYRDFTRPSETRPITWLKISKENLYKL